MTPILGILVPLNLNEKTKRRLHQNLAIPKITNLVIMVACTIFFLNNPEITPTANLLSSIPLSVSVVSFAFKFIANTIYALIGMYIFEGTYSAIKKIHNLPQIAGAFQSMAMILDALMFMNVVYLHHGNLRLDFARMACALILLEFFGITLMFLSTMKLLRDVKMLRNGMTVLEIKYQKTMNGKKDNDYIYYVI